MEKITLRAAKQAATKREHARVYDDMDTSPRDIVVEHGGHIYERRVWHGLVSFGWGKWKKVS